MFLLECLDLLERYRTLAVDPFAVDVVLIMHIDDPNHALNVLVSDEAEAARLLRPLIPHYHAVVHGSKLQEVLPEVVLLQIVRQATDKNLFILWIHVVQF